MQQTTCDTGNLVFVVTLQLCDCCVVTTISQIVSVTLWEMTVHCLLFLSGIKPLYKKVLTYIFSVCYQWITTFLHSRALKLEKLTIESGEISQSTGGRRRICFSYNQNVKKNLSC